MGLLTPTVRLRLHTYAYSITRDSGAADTLLLDAIEKCAERTDLTRVQPGKLMAYLKMILRNKAFDWLRRAKTRREYLELCHETSIRSAFAEAISAEALEVFDKVVAKLPKHFRRVVVLRVIDQLSFREIALKMRIKVGTVLSRFWRAKQELGRWIRYMKAE